MLSAETRDMLTHCARRVAARARARGKEVNHPPRTFVAVSILMDRRRGNYERARELADNHVEAEQLIAGIFGLM